MFDDLVLRRESPTLFTARLDGQLVGRCAVAISDRVWEMYTTSVDPEHEGQGIASALVRFALDAAAADGVTVIPSCWYVDGWISRHPEYAHLRAGDAGQPVGGPEDPHCRLAPAVVTD